MQRPEHQRSDSTHPQAAFRQSFDSANPRALLARLFELNPKADRKALFDKFHEVVRKKPRMERSCIHYWYDHAYNSLLRLKNPRLKNAKEAQEAREAREAREQTLKDASDTINEAVVHKARDFLRTVTLPSGVLLSEATGRDCINAQGWYKEIGKRVGPKGVVGDVLTNKQIAKIYKSHHSE